jgi:shikimate dehydrogenase
MQEAGFQALNLNWRYLTIEVYPQDLGAAMQGVRAFNMKGINLTIPHKVEVLKYLDEVKPDAALMGAVNTVVRIGEKLIGENTDGKGFMHALTHDAKVNPKGKRVLVLGSGGAARSITVELALAGAQQITIVNRSSERGKVLTELLNSKTPTKANFIQWQGTYAIPKDTDILVNATSIGLFPNVHEKPDINYASISSEMVVCDVIHTPMTPFLKEAQDRGAKVVVGLGMLVYQGAIGFKLWTGLDAPVEAMHKALSKAFNLE